MLTTERALAIAAADSGGATIDQAWSDEARLVAFFVGIGSGPTVVDLKTGRMTFPGSATDPAEIIAGMSRLSL